MERLTEKDFRAILEFLHTSYSTSNSNDFMNHLLLGLKRLVPCEFSAYCEMDPRIKSSVNRIEPTGALSAEDVFCMTLPTTSANVHGLAIHRSRRNFTERERLILNLLRPHLTQARQNARMVARLEEELCNLTEAFENMKYGLVVLDSSSRPRLITPRARKWFADFFEGARQGNGGLPQTVRDWIFQQRGILESGNLSTRLAPLVVERPGHRLILSLLSGERETLLLEEISTDSDPRRLDFFGLSHRESEVLGWASQGKTNSEIGMILSISCRTVQKHLEHVFQKIGVETRTAAAARFLEGAGKGAPPQRLGSQPLESK